LASLTGEDDEQNVSKSKKSHKKSSSSLPSAEGPPKVKAELYDAGPAAYPTENAKKYGDVKDPKIKKQRFKLISTNNDEKEGYKPSRLGW